jgi:hypothetical protein
MELCRGNGRKNQLDTEFFLWPVQIVRTIKVREETEPGGEDTHR